jgi:hypothetical protein
MFPEHQAFSSIRIDTGKGVDGFEPVLSALRRRGDYVRTLEARYRSGTTPIAFIGAAAGSTMFDVWDDFSANPDIPIFSAAGTPEEFARAADRIAKAKVAILDPLTAYAAVRVGTAPGLKVAFPRLGVTQTTRDLLHELLEGRRRDALRRFGTMGWTGEHYVMHQQSAEGAARSVEYAEAAVAFAADCELMPAEGGSAVKDAAREIWRFLPDALFDSILAAQAENAILISDDAPLRAIAEESAQIATAWSQPALQHALRTGRLDPCDYAESVGKLIEAQYQFTMFGALELVHEFRKTGWQSTGRFPLFLALLARPSNERDSLVRVLAEFTQAGWGETGGDARFRRILRSVFKAMQAINTQLDFPHFAR